MVGTNLRITDTGTLSPPQGGDNEGGRPNDPSDGHGVICRCRVAGTTWHAVFWGRPGVPCRGRSLWPWCMPATPSTLQEGFAESGAFWEGCAPRKLCPEQEPQKTGWTTTSSPLRVRYVCTSQDPVNASSSSPACTDLAPTLHPFIAHFCVCPATTPNRLCTISHHACATVHPPPTPPPHTALFKHHANAAKPWDKLEQPCTPRCFCEVRL